MSASHSRLSVAEEREQPYKEIFEAVSDGIIVVDIQSRAIVEATGAPFLLHQDDLRDGRLAFLTTGILHASAITTVSPTYAREIQTPEQGFGLDGLLRQRREVLFGILNGSTLRRMSSCSLAPRARQIFVYHDKEID